MAAMSATVRRAIQRTVASPQTKCGVLNACKSSQRLGAALQGRPMVMAQTVEWPSFDPDPFEESWEELAHRVAKTYVPQATPVSGDVADVSDKERRDEGPHAETLGRLREGDAGARKSALSSFAEVEDWDASISSAVILCSSRDASSAVRHIAAEMHAQEAMRGSADAASALVQRLQDICSSVREAALDGLTGVMTHGPSSSAETAAEAFAAR